MCKERDRIHFIVAPITRDRPRLLDAFARLAVSSAKDTGIAEQTDKTDAAITAGEPSSAETDGEDRTGVADTDVQTPVSAGETSEDTQTTGVQTTGVPDTEPVTSTEKTKDETSSSTEKETEEHPDDDNVDWDAWQT